MLHVIQRAEYYNFLSHINPHNTGSFSIYHHNPLANMARPSMISIILLSLTTFLFLHIPQIHAQPPSAPAPSPPGPINITEILAKGGQYNTFIRLLRQTQTDNQLNNQVNSSSEGLTIFAPTDNAFANLPPGTLNKLSNQQQIQLVLYHVLPKYYTLSNLQTVSNPARTLASGQDGKPFGLNFIGQANQLNVSTGVVETQIYNAVRQESPLAVYQVDKVLLPSEFSESKSPSPAPRSSPPSSTTERGDSDNGNTAASHEPSSPPNSSQQIHVGLGLLSGLWLLCIAVLS